jgi:hypothetical protein
MNWLGLIPLAWILFFAFLFWGYSRIFSDSRSGETALVAVAAGSSSGHDIGRIGGQGQLGQERRAGARLAVQTDPAPERFDAVP